MMRLIQKLDKFDTSKLEHYLGVNFSLILTNQRRENSPYAILPCDQQLFRSKKALDFDTYFQI
jgi:hypothetical protein